MLFHIVARAKNHTIGRDGKIPWHLSADLQYFKKTTMGHPVLMGRKTYESIGRPLPGRMNLVISSTMKLNQENLKSFTSVQDALDFVEANPKLKQDVFVIGGGQIYKETAPLVERVYLTEIDSEFPGDTYYELPQGDWHETFRESHAEPLEYAFLVLSKSLDSTASR